MHSGSAHSSSPLQLPAGALSAQKPSCFAWQIVIFLSIVLYFSAWERQLCGSYLVVTMLNQHGREFLKLNGEYRFPAVLTGSARKS